VSRARARVHLVDVLGPVACCLEHVVDPLAEFAVVQGVKLVEQRQYHPRLEYLEGKHEGNGQQPGRYRPQRDGVDKPDNSRACRDDEYGRDDRPDDPVSYPETE
jgi:hypothetical protein